MKRSTHLLRLLGGAVLFVGIGGCSDNPVAPDEQVAFAAGGVTFSEFTATDIPTGGVPGESWIADGVLHIRGGLVYTWIVATGNFPVQLTCSSQIGLNANFLLADWSGPTWGKISCTNAAGGVWEGSFTGQREMVSPGLWRETHKIVLRGVGANIDGYQVRATEVVESNDPTFQSFWVGYINGTLFDPR